MKQSFSLILHWFLFKKIKIQLCSGRLLHRLTAFLNIALQFFYANIIYDNMNKI